VSGRRRFDPGRPLFFLPLITDLRRRLSTFLGGLFAGAGSDAGSAPTEALEKELLEFVTRTGDTLIGRF
jgi:hypothetical protein